MIVHVVFIFITPDTHTVWELKTPNDNGRNMARCKGLKGAAWGEGWEHGVWKM